MNEPSEINLQKSQGIPLFENVPPGVSLEVDTKLGAWIQVEAEERAAWHKLPLGDLVGVRCWAALHRYEPYWNTACCGEKLGAVPPETQFLLTELEDGQVALLVPLVDGDFRATLQGEGERGLALIVESNDPAVVTDHVTGVFIAMGDQPFDLLEQAAIRVMDRLKTGRMRSEKGVPRFMDQFGWCTWDAFYMQVSHALVQQGLESFKQGGVQPKWLIIDDGWQQINKMPTGEYRLTGFAANEKFPGGLVHTVRMAKEDYGIETFTVWHAVLGYWGGVDGQAFPGYAIRPMARSFGQGILHHCPDHNHTWWGHIVGTVPPEHLPAFYNNYHRALRLQGVDGIKVDNQASIEGVCAGYGGRVAYMRAVREALEGSAQVYFLGNLTNCMSNANEMLYGALNSNLTRTSTDFWPWKPETHGRHLYVNALAGAWFGEFIWPDWDMFQSGHPAGGFHAAGRAVSGAPVFVSDKPGEHDFDLLRKLVLPDGRTLRAQCPGRPTRDCLFVDPTRADVLYKIWSLNTDAGVVGVFNCRYSGDTEGNIEKPMLQGAVQPGDVDALEADRYAVYAHSRRELRTMERKQAWNLVLPELGYEVFTIVPVRNGAAPLGLVDYFNSAAAVLAKRWLTADIYHMQARGKGLFLVWLDRPVKNVRVNGEPVPFSFVRDSGLLSFDLPGDGDVILEVSHDG